MYTLYCKGTTASEPRRLGVGFAVKNHVANLQECLVHISDRITTLRLHLSDRNYLNVVSSYAPTLDSADDVKDKFYEELSQCLEKIHPRESILVLGHFNARVGRDYEAWPKILERYGVGSMNSNGQLPLSLRVQYQLTITVTLLRLSAKHKTTWMHPRSKHWHLIDNLITRSFDEETCPRS